MRLIVFYFLVVFSVQLYAQLCLPDKNYTNFELHTIIIKLKPENRSLLLLPQDYPQEIKNLVETYSVTSIKKIYPKHRQPSNKVNKYNQPLVDLSLIYILKFSQNVPIEKLMFDLYNTNYFEYVDVNYIHTSQYTPNDPAIGSQYYLNNVQAFAGWDICQGSDTVVTGIVDTGIDIDHEDLTNDIMYNDNDPVDGVDNDNDGYVDNYRGWDLGENDNNPQVSAGGPHGIAVSGLTSATVDNNTGMAGVDFKCKVLPVKVSNASGGLSASYDGIIYAADHGCDIINCSWGRVGSPGTYGQDIINYATYNKNALVFAAAGNDGNEDDFYPASYNNVISVAATNSSDSKWSDSNYGRYIDVSAPGKDTYKTTDNNGYNASGSGTSFASPIAAGCAAIIKSYFPEYNAVQIGEQLKVSADNIDTILANSAYEYKLGMGRVNLYRALTDTNKPSIRIVKDSAVSSGNNMYLPGDTVYFYADFLNYLKPANNVTCTLECPSFSIQILDNNSVLGSFNTYQTKNNNQDPFVFVVDQAVGLNESVDLLFKFQDSLYSGFQWIEFPLNRNYADFTINDIHTTITSTGSIGYTTSSHTNGLGISYNNLSVLFHGGLVLGTSGSQVSDNTYNDTGYDDDFSPIKSIKIPQNSAKGDYEVFTYFNDSSAASPIGLEITQHSFAWANIPNEKAVFMEYNLTNKSNDTLNSLYAGIYMDFDVYGAGVNYAKYDETRTMCYTYDTVFNSYVGVQVLSDTNVFGYVFNNDGSNGSINIWDGYSSSEKYQTLTNSRENALLGDVSQIISTYVPNLNPNDSAKVLFVLIAADSLSELQAIADRTWQRYAFRADFIDTVGISCFGFDDGQIIVKGKDGFEPYTYQWLSPASGTDTVLQNLSVGYYAVQITDSIGNQIVDSVFISEPSLLTASISAFEPITCLATENASATITPSGGTPPYSYLWNDPLAQTDSVAQSLSAGNFVAIVKDANNCYVSKIVEVSDTTALQLQINKIGYVKCNDTVFTDTIHINATGGLGEYTYQWLTAPANTDSFLTNVDTGMYVISVIDTAMCNITDTVVIENAPAIDIAYQIEKPLCNGDSNGYIVVEMISGVYPANYTWAVGGQDSILSNISAGNYAIEIQDANNCMFYDTLSVTQPNLLIANFENVKHVSCCDYCDGSVKVQPTGGTAPYAYQWNDAMQQQTAFVDNLCAGFYNVQITDLNNCTHTKGILIEEPTCMQMSLNQSNVLCNGDSSGSIMVSVQGGYAPYSYYWSHTIADTNYVTNVSEGYYTIDVFDSMGCIINSVVYISEPEPLSISISDFQNVKCNGICTGKATVMVDGGTAPYMYSWLGNSGTAPTVANLCAGLQMINVTDLNGCTDSTSVLITQPEQLLVDLHIINESAYMASDGKAWANVSGGVQPYNYLWGNGSTDTIAENLTSGQYQLVVLDSNYCQLDTMFDINYGNAIFNTQYDALAQVNIYPNPTVDGLVYVQIMSNVAGQKCQISVLNSIGQTIKELNIEVNLNKGQNLFKLNLSEFNPGLYYIQLSNSNLRVIKPVIVE